MDMKERVANIVRELVLPNLSHGDADDEKRIVSYTDAICALFAEEREELTDGDVSRTSDEWRTFLHTNGESEWDGGLLQETLIDDMEITEDRLALTVARAEAVEAREAKLREALHEARAALGGAGFNPDEEGGVIAIIDAALAGSQREAVPMSCPRCGTVRPCVEVRSMMCTECKSEFVTPEQLDASLAAVREAKEVPDEQA